eukprot:jgi/Mesen1/9930/ME000070S09214
MAQSLLVSSQLRLSGLVGSVASIANVSGLESTSKASISTPVGLPSLSIRAEQKPVKSKAAEATSIAVLASLVSLPDVAGAVTAEDVSSVLTQAQDIAGQASGAAVSTYDTAKSLLEQLLDAAKPAIETASPVVTDAAKKALDAAAPVASNVAAQAQKALVDAGIDTAPVYEAAKEDELRQLLLKKKDIVCYDGFEPSGRMHIAQTAASVAEEVGSQTGQALKIATPYAESTLESVLSQDPSILAAGAGALVLLYLLAPSLGSALASNVRGYRGNFSAAQALDLLATQDYLLIDVRADKEKARSGTPSLPRNAKKKLVSVPVEELPSKLKGQLRNTRKVEAELCAIKIAALKRIGKGSRVILIDSNGDIAKTIAKALSSLGFGSVYVVTDGVDGSKGWVQSQLATDAGGYSRSEVLSPSRVIPAASRVFGTQRSNSDVVDVASSRRGFYLPGGSDE